MSYKQRQKIKKDAKYKARQEAKASQEFADKVMAQMFPIAVTAVKDVFKERATNPKCEQFVIRMLSLMEQIGEGKVSLNTLTESMEMETGIQYDCEEKTVRNIRRKR